MVFRHPCAFAQVKAAILAQRATDWSMVDSIDVRLEHLVRCDSSLISVLALVAERGAHCRRAIELVECHGMVADLLHIVGLHRIYSLRGAMAPRLAEVISLAPAPR